MKLGFSPRLRSRRHAPTSAAERVTGSSTGAAVPSGANGADSVFPEGAASPSNSFAETAEASVGEETLGDSSAAPPLLRSSVSLLASVLLHCLLVVVLGLLTWGRSVEQTLPGEEIELAAFPGESLSQDQFTADELEAPSRSEETFEETELALPADPLQATEQLAAVTPELQLSGGGELAAFGLGGGGGSGAGGQASFMGVQAYGRRFCIIADRSGSMKGRPLDRLKAELRTTLDTMTLGSSVHIILYSGSCTAFPDGWAIAQSIEGEADVWLRGIRAEGGTNPAPAFDRAFALEPPPDAIFFMTDGKIPPTMDAHVAGLNGKTNKRIPVHTISFLHRGAARLMQRIADESGGKYRHVAGF